MNHVQIPRGPKKMINKVNHAKIGRDGLPILFKTINS